MRTATHIALAAATVALVLMFFCCGMFFLMLGKTEPEPQPFTGNPNVKPRRIEPASEEEAVIQAAREEVVKFLGSANLGPGRAKQLAETTEGHPWQVQFDQFPSLTSAHVYKDGGGCRVELISVNGAAVIRGEGGAWQWADGPPKD